MNVEFISPLSSSVALLAHICKDPNVHTLLLQVPSGELRYHEAALARFLGSLGSSLSLRDGKGKGPETK